MKLKSASFSGKTEFNLPEGATIIKKDYSVRVEEIENGFIISKSYDIKYQILGNDDTSYEYFTKQWYSKENPLADTMEEEDEPSLADKFE